MHSALLIDEILRHIFHFASEDHKPSLISAALTCKAWHDPALDFAWNRLSSLKPLLRLLSTILVVDGEYALETRPSDQDLQIFSSYARRIKHISHRQELRIHPRVAAFISSAPRADALPNLSTTYISFSTSLNCVMPLYLSANLGRLEIDLGFKPSSCTANDVLCDYLEHNTKKLQHLNLRGHLSQRLNNAVSRLTDLQSISLRLGSSLLPQTLQAVMNFPNLLELEVHAGHIKLDDIYDAYNHDTITTQDYTIFASLVKLHIRAKKALVDYLLRYIPTGTLRHLHIELDNSSSCTTFWDTSFDSISKNCANSLKYLSLEHHFDILDPSISSDTLVPPQIFGGLEAPGLTYQAIERLRNLQVLQHFSYDVTLPPFLNDEDLKKIITWWPNLRHFELGSSLSHDEYESVKPCQITSASLSYFANQVPKLERLILPITISDSHLPNTTQTMINTLKSLTIEKLETVNPTKLAQSLHRLFPSLRSLDGPCDDAQVWVDTVNTLQNLVSST